MKKIQIDRHSLLFIICVFILAACGASEPIAVPSATLPSATQTSTPAFTPTANSTATSKPSPSPFPTATATLKPSGDQQVVLMAVGDMMLGRTIGEMIKAEGALAPYVDTWETLSSADITIGNLECPISNRGQPEEKTYAFRAPPESGEALALAGFDLVSLANNHILDYGPLALQDTLDILTSHQIQAVGAGLDAEQAYAPVFIDLDGLRLAFLAFADIPPADYDYRAWEAGTDKPGIAWAHPERVRTGVTAAKKDADVVIVLIHNGFEIVQKVSAQQQEIAHLAVDSGASMVIGSHPHVLQRIETYQQGIIFYSMGNFVFDNFLFPPNYSAILQAELSPAGVNAYEMIDVIIQLNGVPQIMPYDLEDQ